ncbi:MAG: hypothetical protein SGARI_001613, partial [Bacillariaceae sp.]
MLQKGAKRIPYSYCCELTIYGRRYHDVIIAKVSRTRSCYIFWLLRSFTCFFILRMLFRTYSNKPIRTKANALCSIHIHGRDFNVRQGNASGHDRMRLDNGISQSGRQTRCHGQQTRVVDLVTEQGDFVRLEIIALVFNGRVLANDADIAVGSRSQIVKDTGTNGTLDQLDGGSFVHILAPGRFKDRHGRQRTRSHGGVIQLGGTAMRMDLVDGRSVDITSTKDQGGTDMSLVLEETSLQQ